MMLTPGFANPVFDSQACFRAVLDAMARPGTRHTVYPTLTAPPPLDRATAALLLTLVDAETPIWLDPAAGAAGPWLDFHTGAPWASLETAQFAIALSAPPLASLEAGSEDAPERGATLILQVAALCTGRRRYRLAGPGLSTPQSIAIDGLPPSFTAEWAANHALFPRGVDLILCAGNHLAAFPRTLRIELL